MIIRNEFDIKANDGKIVVNYFPQHILDKINIDDCHKNTDNLSSHLISMELTYIIEDDNIKIISTDTENVILNSLIDDFHKFTEGSHKEGVIKIPRNEIDIFICSSMIDIYRDNFFGIIKLFISEILLTIIDEIYPELEDFEDTIFANSSKYDNIIWIGMDGIIEDFRRSTNPSSYMGVRPESKKKDKSVLVNFLRLLNRVSKNGFEIYSNMLLLFPNNEPIVIHFEKGSYDIFEIMEECSIENTCIYRGDFIKIMERIIMLHVDKESPVDISTGLDIYSETFSGYLEFMKEFPEKISYDVVRPIILNSIAILDVDDENELTDTYLLK